MELHDRRQVREVYTIRQVVEMTGVPDNTIRSWERRFGIPSPDRSGSNQRRYHQRDVDAIRSIQAARERGRTMEQAIQEVLAAEPVIVQEIPTDVEPLAKTPLPVARTPVGAWIDRLLSALAEFDGAQAESLVADQVWATSVEETCVCLLRPAAEVIAEGAAAGRLPPVGARFAEAWIHGKLLAALEQSHPSAGGTHIVVAAMHDDSAIHPALGVAILMSRAGHRVTWLGANVPVAEVDDAVDRLLPAAAVLAARSPLSIAATAGAVQRLGDRRRARLWHGVSAVTGFDDSDTSATIILPVDTRKTVSALESAMRTQESSLRLVRNP